MQLETMFVTHDGPIATLRLNRTERLNAFGNQGTVDLNTVADALAHDGKIRPPSQVPQDLDLFATSNRHAPECR